MDSEQATKIAEAIASQFGLTVEKLRKHGHSAHISNTRNFSYYILHYTYGVSLNELASMYDRTNREVCYRLEDLRKKHENVPAFRKRCDTIIKKIEEKQKNPPCI